MISSLAKVVHADSYKLKLPHNLPPTYRGKSMRFNYYLVIGSQRSGSNASSTPFGAQGHVVQIPFRVFNHVTGNMKTIPF